MLCAWRNVDTDVLLNYLGHVCLTDTQHFCKGVSMHSKVVNVNETRTYSLVGFIDDLVSEHVHDISLLVNLDVRKDILLCKHIQKVGYNLLHHPRRFTFVVIHRTYCLQPLIRRLTSEE
jgi:hypothetical protein